ncbi:MAG: DUF72 domain-containing protein [Thermoplasmata archaeon]
MVGNLRIGTSSWTSPAWAGRFYPAGIRNGDRLSYYAQFYDVVEVDSTYYRDPGASMFVRLPRTPAHLHDHVVCT